MSNVKRLLSIDGGGIRGIVAAQILVEIEYSLRDYYQDDNYRLCHFFDLIGGTSTGSLIAAGLAKGMLAEDILKIYVKNGESIFRKKLIPRLIARLPQDRKPFAILSRLGKLLAMPTYGSGNLETLLEEELGNMELRDSELKTKLLIIARNISQGESWNFCNHENNIYYNNNKEIRIRDLVRASCAAPTFFSPHKIRVSKGGNLFQDDTFIDGGIGMYENPSYQVFLEATKAKSEGGLGWDTGIDKLLVISIGTGYHKIKLPPTENLNIINLPNLLIKSMLYDANREQVHLMERIGFSPNIFDNSTGNRKKVRHINYIDAVKEFGGRSFCYFRLTSPYENLDIGEILNVYDIHDGEKIGRFLDVNDINSLEDYDNSLERSLENVNPEGFKEFRNELEPRISKEIERLKALRGDNEKLAVMHKDLATMDCIARISELRLTGGAIAREQFSCEQLEDYKFIEPRK